MAVMNRRLVLTSEDARHPFRQTLPPHVLRPLPEPEPEVADAMARAEAPLFQWDEGDKQDDSVLDLVTPLPALLAMPAAAVAAAPRPGLITRQDVKDFLLAYCACLIAVGTFIF